MNQYIEKDLKYIWHPCSQMKDYEDIKPIVIEKGEGCFLYDMNGKKYLDCISSWWANLFGHSSERINKAIENQIRQIEHVIFANFTNKPAIELAEKLIEISPDRLKKIYFSDNGSSAVEIALKMSFQYHQQKGKIEKKRFAAITGAYHGETLGALSVCDLDMYTTVYKPLLMDTLMVPGPDCYRCPYSLDRACCNAECFEKMEKALSENHEELCAVIIEPMVQGAAGMKMYSPAYLKKLRKACDAYDIHLIADEIAVGFGRTGTMFACEHAGISPDIMCLSKGISAGYMPMSAVLASDGIYYAFYGDYKEKKAFIHSHTYAGNAMACAAALESLRIFEDENVLEANKKKSELIKKLAQEKLGGHPHVGEVRSMGMITALEIVKDRRTKEPFLWEERVLHEIYKIALRKGLILRPIANVVYFMPPYVIDEHAVNFMIDACLESIEEYFACREKI